MNLLRRYGWLGSFRLFTHVLFTRICFRPARLIRFPIYIRGRSAMVWGKGFTTGVGVRLDAFGHSPLQIIIGENVQLNDYVHIGAIEEVSIGNDVLIASRVFITDHNHGEYSGTDRDSSPQEIPIVRDLVSKPVKIGNKVWLGEGVTVLAGVTIGEGSIIGAGAVVTSSIAPNSIATGVPAKVIKQYNFQQKRWLAV